MQVNNDRLKIMMALALVRNQYKKGLISELVYRNICREYERKVEKNV